MYAGIVMVLDGQVCWGMVSLVAPLGIDKVYEGDTQPGIVRVTEGIVCALADALKSMRRRIRISM